MEITNKPSLVDLFNKLPQEIKVTVFEFLDGNSLAALGSTCRMFRVLTESKSLWTTLLAKVGMLQEYQFTKSDNSYLSNFANIFVGRSVIVTEKEAYLRWINKIDFAPKR